jgi:DNA-binding beta-propeller fold protein YncE
MNASVVIGQTDFTSKGTATTQSGLNFPFVGTAVNGGNLFVSDNANDRVLEFTPPFTNGMNASVVFGAPDFTTPGGGGATQTRFDFPQGLAFDLNGNLYVAVVGDNRVLQFRPPFTNGMKASVVLGQPDFTTVSSGITQDMFVGCTGVGVEPKTGHVFVADFDGNRVMEFVPPFTNGMNASVVIGQSSFKTNVSALSQTGLSGPHDVVFDAAGNLWVLDENNQRALEFKPPFTTGMKASLVLGEPDFTSSGGLVGPATFGFGSPLTLTFLP